MKVTLKLFVLFFIVFLFSGINVHAAELNDLDAEHVPISGYSSILETNVDTTLFRYVKECTNYLNNSLGYEFDYKLFIALFKQESQFKGDNLGQVTFADDILLELENKSINVKPLKTKIGSIDYAIASIFKKYDTLYKYRMTISDCPDLYEVYIIKLYNSGSSLTKVREAHVDEYPLTLEGDKKFIEDFENFDSNIGKKLFKEYLYNVGSKYALQVRSNINSRTTYKDYINSGKLYSDPKYCENILIYYNEYLDFFNN